MTRKGGQRKLKRYAAPPCFQIPVKAYKWVVHPNPGPHPMDYCVPLALILRDFLKYARTLREVKYILNQGYVRVDGVVRRDYKFPVGVMDVISVDKVGKHFRVLPRGWRLVLTEISEEEASLKVCRVNNKTTVKGGHIQVTLHDGRNVLFQVSDPRQKPENVPRVGDGLFIRVPEQEVLAHLPLRKGVVALIYRGTNAGIVGKISEIKPLPRRKLVTIDAQLGGTYRTIHQYIMPVGDQEPVITIPQPIQGIVPSGVLE